MAKRSQKSRFGPGKDRIKPDADTDAAAVESEDDQSDDDAIEADSSVADDQSRGDSRSGKGKKGEKGKPRSESADDAEGAGSPEDEAADEDADDELTSAYISNEGDQNPQTCCSSCHTVFEVSRELLESSDTRVRCGECLSIFDALANLRENEPDDEESETATADERDPADKQNGGDKPPPAMHTGSSVNSDTAASPGDASPLDVTYADFALFSADAGLPELDYLDETREVPPFDFDDPGDEDEMDESMDQGLYTDDVIEDARGTLSDAPSEQGDEASGDDAASEPGELTSSRVDEQAPAADEIDELLNSLKSSEMPALAEEEPVGAWWFRGLLFLGVLVLAAGLYGYREREALQNNSLARPVLESICSLFGCTVAERVDLAALKVTRRTVFSHPDDDDMLIINIGFVNQAEFAQRYPTLEMLLTDRSGRLIVKHVYEPADYLDSWQAGDVLDVGKSLDISLSVEDPGREAMSFELDFR